MNVNGHLTRLAATAIIRRTERGSISRSLDALKARLKTHFRNDISKRLVFGSYKRGTILPRVMDTHSDIDYMVIFSDGSFKPQTYLNHLRVFVKRYYKRSQITQSNPTIVLILNHIRFDLVPAIVDGWDRLKIPAKASDYEDWILTDPADFNKILSSANQSNQNLIKPLVRLVKYWNACNNYPFESYNLEQMIVSHRFKFSYIRCAPQLKDYFYSFMRTLYQDPSDSQYKQIAINKAKQTIDAAVMLDHMGHHKMAEFAISKLLPRI